jgi:RimJ/RimL family protein N-acetyltransferase
VGKCKRQAQNASQKINRGENLPMNSIQKISMSEYKPQEQKVSLKAFTVADLDDFMEWATDNEVTKHMMWNGYTSRSEAESFFANVVEKHPWFKAVCLGDKVVGSIMLDKGKGAHSCKAELGYVIARKYWGNGLATQAIHLAIQYGFKDLDIERIEAYVDPANIASQRVLKKNGFTKEGLLRNFIVQKGILKDRFIYAFLKPIY